MYWYALRTKPHKERVVNRLLLSKEITVFFPSIRVKPTNPRAAKIRPYFPGYLFVQADLDEIGRSTLDYLPGTHGLVAFGGQPARVPEHLIRELQERLQKLREEDVQKRRFQKGDRVRIVEGPFAGYDAIFDMHLSGKERVRVLLAFLSQQPKPVKLKQDDIVKIS